MEWPSKLHLHRQNPKTYLFDKWGEKRRMFDLREKNSPPGKSPRNWGLELGNGEGKKKEIGKVKKAKVKMDPSVGPRLDLLATDLKSDSPAEGPLPKLNKFT